MMRERPAFYWAALAMLLFFGALLVPTEWTRAVGSLLDPTANPETTAFSPDVSRLDRALRQGRSVELSAKRLDRLKPYLQARRLSRLGPMTESDIERAVEMFEEFQMQTTEGMAPASRQALRDHTIKEILNTFPRLRDTTDSETIRRTLDRLDAQIERARKR